MGLNFLLEESTEWTFVGVSMMLGLVSLGPAYFRRHRKCCPLALFCAGVILLLMARVWLKEESNIEVPVAVSGALLISVAHFLNHRLCRACVRCADDCE